MVSITENDDGRTVDVRVGEPIVIELSENATTGYRWAIERYDQETIQDAGSESRYPANLIGSGGQVSFTFKGKKAGRGEIALKRWREWEGDASIIGRFRLRCNVLP
jgi:inhibitor of cysteine peptidase